MDRTSDETPPRTPSGSDCRSEPGESYCISGALSCSALSDGSYVSDIAPHEREDPRHQTRIATPALTPPASDPRPEPATDGRAAPPSVITDNSYVPSVATCQRDGSGHRRASPLLSHAPTTHEDGPDAADAGAAHELLGELVLLARTPVETIARARYHTETYREQMLPYLPAMRELSQLAKELCGPAQKRQRNDKPQGARKKKTNAEYFWTRLHTFSSKPLTPSPVLQKLVSQPTLRNLFLVQRISPPPQDRNLRLSNALHFNNAVNLMISVQDRSEQCGILLILLHLFFFLARHPNPEAWGAENEGRMHVVNERVGEELFDKYLSLVPANGAETISRDTFLGSIRGWVSVGSKYAYIAQNTSLGSLLHLQSHLQPCAMYGCSKGGERDHVSQRILCAVSDRVRPAADASGANEAAHRLLWALMGGFWGIGGGPGGEFPFPGFP